MCRNIKTLHNFSPPATNEEISVSALQFVRKLSGCTRPAKINQDAFDRAVDEVARAAEPVGAFPHAKRVGDLLFLSGIGPRVRGSKEIPGVTLDAERNIVSYDIEKQCRAVFENVRLVLEDAGASWNDIVDVTVFLTNM